MYLKDNLLSLAPHDFDFLALNILPYPQVRVSPLLTLKHVRSPQNHIEFFCVRFFHFVDFIGLWNAILAG